MYDIGFRIVFNITFWKGVSSSFQLLKLQASLLEITIAEKGKSQTKNIFDVNKSPTSWRLELTKIHQRKNT